MIGFEKENVLLTEDVGDAQVTVKTVAPLQSLPGALIVGTFSVSVKVNEALSTTATFGTHHLLAEHTYM